MNFKQLLLSGILGLAVSASLQGGDLSTNSAPVAPIPPPLLVSTATDAGTLPVAIPVTDVNIHYMGRFDSSKGDPRCSWTASTIMLKFQGTDLNARMEDGGSNYWEIEIDGQPVRKMALGTGSHLYRIASGLASGPHVVRLVRATEANFGPTQIHGFQLNQGGSLLPTVEPAHRLEVIGDSISCGDFNEALPDSTDPQNTTENGYLSYGESTAVKLGLDYRCVSWSGRKMWPNKMIPDVYDKAIPTEQDTEWDFSKWVPEVILINLSTNDFSHGPVDEAGWTTAYEKFVNMLRSHFPGAEIYCATSPMLTDDRLNTSKVYLRKVVDDLHAAGDIRVQYFEFEHEDPKVGMGGHHHPNVITDQIMGDKLAAQLTKDLEWTCEQK